MLQKIPSVGCVKQLVRRRGYSGFDGDDGMGLKIKSQQSTWGFQQNRKSPWTKKYPPPTKKVSHVEFSRLKTPKNIFCFIKNIHDAEWHHSGIKNFKPKKAFHHPRHLKSGVPTWVKKVVMWKCKSIRDYSETKFYTIFHSASFVVFQRQSSRKSATRVSSWRLLYHIS